MQSNEFSFSVTKENVAQQLLQVSGREVNVHYHQYFGSLPWRGMQKFIVDSIYEVRGIGRVSSETEVIFGNSEWAIVNEVKDFLFTIHNCPFTITPAIKISPTFYEYPVPLASSASQNGCG